MRLAWVSLFLSFAIAGCDGQDDVLLLIDLRTDIVPGVEFDEVRTLIGDAGEEAGRFVTTAASAGDDYIAGHRVAELDGLTPGPLAVRVRLLRGGDLILERPVQVSLTGRLAITIVVTRDCRGVSCPAATDQPSESACLASRCVEPTCTVSSSETCGAPECAVDSECAAAAPCATPRCVSGSCLYATAGGTCSSGQYCDPEMGCVSLPSPTDAGPDASDARPDSDTGVDGAADTGRDAGPMTTCGRSAVPVATVSIRHQHTCAVGTDGSLWCFGRNDGRQLGLGDMLDRTRPARVGTDSDWELTSTGDAHTCALELGGSLFCWGANSDGQLGTGDTTFRASPTLIGSGFRAVSAGADYTCGVRTDGRLFCWGDNALGQLGLGGMAPQLVPTRVGLTSDWTTISAGDGMSCGTRGQDLYCWGDNEFGELGVGDLVARDVPSASAEPTGWTMARVDTSHACGRAIDGTISCWGRGDMGRLGTGDTMDRIVPTAIAGGPWQTVTVGARHGCALGAGGALSCWGRNTSGELGLDDTTNRTVPSRVGASSWDFVEGGRYATCAVRAGLLFCWGENLRGQLGVGDVSNRLTPTEVCLVAP